MEKTDLNRRLHEALGKCWHKPASNFQRHCHKCGKTIPKDSVTGNIIRPDYCADPRLVIEAMREREDWHRFCDYIGCNMKGAIQIDIHLMMDTTGKLAKLATDFLNGRTGRKVIPMYPASNPCMFEGRQEGVPND